MATYAVKKTPVDLAGSGWYEILPPAGPVEPLVGNFDADWVVIGAGFAGLSAAKRLTERCPGDRVVVLDAQRIAWGSSGRNSGFMIDLPHNISSETYASGIENDLKQIRMNRFAIDYAANNVQQFGLQDHFSPSGKYHGAMDQRGMQHLSDFCDHLDTLGESYTRLDQARMTEITGTDYYTGGIHAPGTVMIQPAGYIRGLAEGLRPLVELYENSPVMKIETGRSHIVHTPKGKISAARIILTVNGHAQSFGFFQNRLMHVYTFASMTRVLSKEEQTKLGGLNEWGLIPSDPLGTTVRRYRDRLVVRNRFSYNPSLQTSKAQVERLGRQHDLSFEKRFPVIKGVTMEYRWGGALCLSLNSVAAFGEVDERIYAAVCQNGLGTVKGAYGGIAAVDLATGQDNQIVADITSYGPPKKLYPEPFMTVGAKTTLWWKQKRAAKEL